MSETRISTSNHNKDFLLNELKLIQYRNTTIFENRNYFVLSPSVQNKNNWFDIRNVNLIKFPKEKKGKLLIRLFDDFILIDLREFMKEQIDGDPYNTNNSGIHWKFQIRTTEKGEVYIYNTKTKEKFFVEKTDKNGVLKDF
ncbi:hypothetical protein [Maribacter sp. Asnod1-A12]|uniref:hypothetical protein n=1 Tax=Maribacter sp. Asnod1-A12 TaxID=3160576 RepID=UPI003863F0B0